MDNEKLLTEIAGMFREQSQAMAEYIDEKINATVDESERRTRVLIESAALKVLA